jgi:hypothetical protein
VWSPDTSRGRQGARNRRCSQRLGNRRRGGKARKTVAIIQAASGCYSIVTVRRRPFRIIYSGSYVFVQVVNAARIADRSFLADPTSSSAIAPACLTASKSLEPTRDYPETHKSSSSRLVPNTTPASAAMHPYVTSIAVTTLDMVPIVFSLAVTGCLSLNEKKIIIIERTQ